MNMKISAKKDINNAMISIVIATKNRIAANGT